MALSDKMQEIFMGCNHPFKGFKTGNKTEKGKDELIICTSTSGDLLPLSIAESRGFHIAPSAPVIGIDGHTFIKDPIPVPCGNCSGCRMAIAKQWKVRCVLEKQYWRYCYFVTLTYDDAHLPWIDGEAVLSKDDLKDFWKRLRHQFSFRYFACGEYGSTYARPHYHALIFTNRRLVENETIAVNRFRNDILTNTWKNGLVEFSRAESGSISYCCGYVEKKQLDPRWFGYSVKPFRTMSRRPGLGFVYFDQHYRKMFDSGKVYGDFGGSSFATVPHYFRNLAEKYELDITDFKNLLQLNGKRFSDLTDSVFNENNEDLKGFLMDASIDEKLLKLRKEKIT